jgi:hypothetical protein
VPDWPNSFVTTDDTSTTTTAPSLAPLAPSPPGTIARVPSTRTPHDDLFGFPSAALLSFMLVVVSEARFDNIEMEVANILVIKLLWWTRVAVIHRGRITPAWAPVAGVLDVRKIVLTAKAGEVNDMTILGGIYFGMRGNSVQRPSMP